MAVDATKRGALLDELTEGTGEGTLDTFAEWAQSLLDLNQVNSEIKAELLFFINAAEGGGD